MTCLNGIQTLSSLIAITTFAYEWTLWLQYRDIDIKALYSWLRGLTAYRGLKSTKNYWPSYHMNMIRWRCTHNLLNLLKIAAAQALWYFQLNCLNCCLHFHYFGTLITVPADFVQAHWVSECSFLGIKWSVIHSHCQFHLRQTCIMHALKLDI